MKGGVGKTQLTVMTAAALASPPFGLNVAVCDIDYQKSVIQARAVDLQSYGEQIKDSQFFTVFDFSFKEFQKNISKLDKTFDLVFIDVAGKLDADMPLEVQEITKALMYVDFLFMPFVAGSHNIGATITYFRFIKGVQETRQLQPRPLNVFGLVNMHRARSRANQFLTDDIEQLKNSETIMMLNTALGDYAAFREADTIISLYDTNSNDTAKLNFANFINELYNIIA